MRGIHRDGETSFGESLFGLGLIELVVQAAEEEDQQNRLADSDAELSADIQGQFDALDEQIIDLEGDISDLERALEMRSISIRR